MSPYLRDMHGTIQRVNDTRIRLRRDIYDALVAQRGAKTMIEQVRLTGIPRRTLYRILNGSQPNAMNAMRIARALDQPVDVLFEINEVVR